MKAYFAYLAVLVFAFVLGVSIIVASLRYDWYTVPREEVSNFATELYELPHGEGLTQWYAGIKKFETPRKLLDDLGSGLVVFSMILGILFLVSKFPLAGAKTPRWKWFFLVLFWGMLAVQTPLSILYHELRFYRLEYPWWADSIIISIFRIFAFSVIFGILGTLAFLFFLAFSKFPAPLWIWSRRHNYFSWIVSIFFALPIALLLLLLPFTVRDGAFGWIIFEVTLVYLFLSLRAGIIQRKIGDNP